MIKFEHSIFALPFALTGALLAFRECGIQPPVALSKLFWIVIAMVGARSAAMAFNRILDSEIDARNPRTSSRHIPAGLLSRSFTWSFIVGASLVFFAASAFLNSLCLKLGPLALGIIFFYSYTKRFTPLSHLVLGFCLGIAPAAAWIAVAGALDPRILWLTTAVTFWTAGFDIIYSCQDFEFDRKEGLFSVPSQIGLGRSLWVAKGAHLSMVLCLLQLVRLFSLGPLSLVGIAAVIVLLVYEHSLVSPNDLSRVNAAFFIMNGYVSVLFLVFWAADMYVTRVRL